MPNAECQMLKGKNPRKTTGAKLIFSIQHSAFSISSGFTLVELLISVAVIGAVLTVLLGGLASFRRAADMNYAVDGVLNQFREARRRTIESKDASEWGVHVVSSATTLFKGATYSDGAADNEVFTFSTTVTISGLSDVVFKRISGETDNTGALTLTQGMNTRVINVRSSGLVEIQ
ncbi:MAG: type II secretion system protein [Candidatus Sungbacteria bacterium]|nr:type II secretion system protein [Candidatus Sungbacteria bacterium]